MYQIQLEHKRDIIGNILLIWSKRFSNSHCQQNLNSNSVFVQQCHYDYKIFLESFIKTICLWIILYDLLKMSVAFPVPFRVLFWFLVIFSCRRQHYNFLFKHLTYRLNHYYLDALIFEAPEDYATSMKNLGIPLTAAHGQTTEGSIGDTKGWIRFKCSHRKFDQGQIAANTRCYVPKLYFVSNLLGNSWRQIWLKLDERMGNYEIQLNPKFEIFEFCY